MFCIIKTIFTGLLSICVIGSFKESLVSNLKCISLKNQPCKARLTIVNINSDKTIFMHLLLVLISLVEVVNVDDLYDWVCVPNKVKNMNVEVFNLTSGVNETKLIVQHESSANVNWIKVYVLQSKNGIMINVEMSIEN